MNREKAKLMQMEVCKTAQEMYHSGLVAGTWGNISARVDENYMVITPSGMDYERLCPDDMVIVNMNTLEYEGNLTRGKWDCAYPFNLCADSSYSKKRDSANL